MRFNCVCSRVPGKALVVADALSGSKVSSQPQTETTTDLTNEVVIYTEDVTRSWPASSQKLKEIEVDTANCLDLSLVHRFVEDGWPDYAKDVPKSIQSYFAARACLSTVNVIETYLNRIVVPASFRTDTLSRLHAGHREGHQSPGPCLNIRLVADHQSRCSRDRPLMFVL